MPLDLTEEPAAPAAVSAPAAATPLPSPDAAAAADTDVQLAGRSHRHRFEGPAYRRLMVGGIKHIPAWLKRLTMPMWAGLFYALLPKARHAAEKNLDAVLGPAPFFRRKFRTYDLFLHYSHMLSDTYGMHLGLPIDVEVESHHREHMLDALKLGRGAIVMTGHLGMWQIGPFLAEWRGLPPLHMAMAEEPNPMVQAFEQRFRERFRVVYTTQSPFSALSLATALREGMLVGMQLDRHLGEHAIELPMCGRTAWFPTGPATLARATGAPLVPSFFLIEPPRPGQRRRRLVQHIEPRIEVARTRDRAADVAEATARLVASYERFVRAFPSQWYQFYDFFAPPPAPIVADRGGGA